MTEYIPDPEAVESGLIPADEMNPLKISQFQQIIAEQHAAVFLARRFPRDWKLAWSKLQEMCRRKTLAEKAEYKYPRGQKQVKGPSVYIARPLASCWGNLHYGVRIVGETEENITLEGFAWDLESNSRIMPQMTIRKLIQRKKGNMTVWIKPDERDLRELINRESAKLLRNAILQIVPSDFVEDAVALCRETLKGGLKDPKSESKKLILAFGNYGVNVEALNRYIGHDEWSGDDIVDLQAILNSLNDGEAKPSDFFGNGKKEEELKNPINISDMKVGNPATHQSVRGKTTDSVEKDGAVAEILELAKEYEPILSKKLTATCAEENLRGMVLEALGVVKEEILEQVQKAEKLKNKA
jgi:hypothetical protein